MKSLTAVSGIGDDKTLTAVSEIDTQLLIPCENIQKEDFDISLFLGLGFTHHMIIVRKTNSLAEHLFYIRQALAFRINSYYAEKIRGEVLKRIYGRKEKVYYLFSLANCSKAIL